MGNSIWKTLAVVLTVGSLMTLGFSMAVSFGRPDMLLAMRSPDLANYNFESTGGENPQWTVTPRDGRPSLGSFDTPEAAVLRARTDLTSQLNSQRSDFQSQTTEIQNQITAVNALQDQDAQAVMTRADQLDRFAQGIEENVAAQSQRFQAVSRQATEVRNEAARRREDVQRLRKVLEEVRTDLFRVRELRRDLSTEVVGLRMENAALERRLGTLRNPGETTSENPFVLDPELTAQPDSPE